MIINEERVYFVLFFTLLYYTENYIIHCLGYLRNWTDYRFIVFLFIYVAFC